MQTLCCCMAKEQLSLMYADCMCHSAYLPLPSLPSLSSLPSLPYLTPFTQTYMT